MKLVIRCFFICLIVTQFIACEKDSTQPSTSLPVTAGNIAGNFTVGSFTGSSNQTATFSGFTFTFNENGTIVATNGTETYNGTWRFDDSDSNEIKINFSAAPLDQLNGSWHIEELTSDHMYLGDDDDDDDDDDDSSHDRRLEFERD